MSVSSAVPTCSTSHLSSRVKKHCADSTSLRRRRTTAHPIYPPASPTFAVSETHVTPLTRLLRPHRHTQDTLDFPLKLAQPADASRGAHRQATVRSFVEWYSGALRRPGRIIRFPSQSESRRESLDSVALREAPPTPNVARSGSISCSVSTAPNTCRGRRLRRKGPEQLRFRIATN